MIVVPSVIALFLFLMIRTLDVTEAMSATTKKTNEILMILILRLLAGVIKSFSDNVEALANGYKGVVLLDDDDVREKLSMNHAQPGLAQLQSVAAFPVATS